jgi:hypothetical protein
MIPRYGFLLPIACPNLTMEDHVTMTPARQQFVLVPVEWLDDPDLGADEIAVLVALRRHADHKDGTLAVRQGLLATKLKRSRPWVNAVIGRLEALGRLKRFRIEGRRCCGYQLPDVAAIAAARSRTTDTSAASPCPPPDSRSQPDDTELNPANINFSRSGINAECVAFGSADETATIDAHVPAADWQPTDNNLVWAMQTYPDVDLAEHTALFVARSRSKGYAFKDLNAGWRAWLIEDYRKIRAAAEKGAAVPWSGRGGRGRGGDAGYERMAAWAAAAAPRPTVHA